MINAMRNEEIEWSKIADDGNFGSFWLFRASTWAVLNSSHNIMCSTVSAMY